MKMKLNKKGADRVDIETMEWDPQEYDFDSDEFVGVVVLTVEEASEVWDSLVNLVSYAESIEGSLSDLVRDGQRNIDLIRNRIKKVEKNNANN